MRGGGREIRRPGRSSAPLLHGAAA